MAPFYLVEMRSPRVRVTSGSHVTPVVQLRSTRNYGERMEVGTRILSILTISFATTTAIYACKSQAYSLDWPSCCVAEIPKPTPTLRSNHRRANGHVLINRALR